MTIVNICHVLPNDMEVAAASDRSVALIFAKIGCLMGVSWLFALVPYITGIEEFWCAFVIMNGLQGVYIFMASGMIGHFKKMLFQGERPQEMNADAGPERETNF